MAAIWESTADGSWHLLTPSGYHDEAALHDLVAQTPQLLPLAGAPQITVLGREVQLGAGRADLIAVESSGRLVIIEVKLAGNSDARQVPGELPESVLLMRELTRIDLLPTW